MVRLIRLLDVAFKSPSKTRKITKEGWRKEKVGPDNREECIGDKKLQEKSRDENYQQTPSAPPVVNKKDCSKDEVRNVNKKVQQEKEGDY